MCVHFQTNKAVMFPENVDRGQQENEETSNPVPPPHFLNHSSEDEEAGTMASVSMTGQYQLLSQGQVQSTSESDSDSDSDEGTGSTSWHAQFEWNEVQDTQDAVNRIDLEEPLNQENDAKYVDEQSSTREWNRTDDLPERPNIELNQGMTRCST